MMTTMIRMTLKIFLGILNAADCTRDSCIKSTPLCWKQEHSRKWLRTLDWENTKETTLWHGKAWRKFLQRYSPAEFSTSAFLRFLAHDTFRSIRQSSVRPALVITLLSQKGIWIYSDDTITTNQGKLPTRVVTVTPPQEIIQRAVSESVALGQIKSNRGKLFLLPVASMRFEVPPEHAWRQERPADYVVRRL